LEYQSWKLSVIGLFVHPPAATAMLFYFRKDQQKLGILITFPNWKVVLGPRPFALLYSKDARLIFSCLLF